MGKGQNFTPYTYGVGLEITASSFKQVKDDLKLNLDSLAKMVKSYSKVLKIDPNADLTQLFDQMKKMQETIDGINNSENPFSGFVDKGILSRIAILENSIASIGTTSKDVEARLSELQSSVSSMVESFKTIGATQFPATFEHLFGNKNAEIQDVKKQIDMLEESLKSIDSLKEKINSWHQGKNNSGSKGNIKQIQGWIMQYEDLKDLIASMSTLSIDEIYKTIQEITDVSIKLNNALSNKDDLSKFRIDDTYVDNLKQFLTSDITAVFNNAIKITEQKQKELKTQLKSLSAEHTAYLSGRVGKSLTKEVGLSAQVHTTPKVNTTEWANIINDAVKDVEANLDPVRLTPTFLKNSKSLKKNIEGNLAEINHAITVDLDVKDNLAWFNDKIQRIDRDIKSAKESLEKSGSFKLKFELDKETFSQDLKDAREKLKTDFKDAPVNFVINNQEQFLQSVDNLKSAIESRLGKINVNLGASDSLQSNVTPQTLAANPQSNGAVNAVGNLSEVAKEASADLEKCRKILQSLTNNKFDAPEFLQLGDINEKGKRIKGSAEKLKGILQEYKVLQQKLTDKSKEDWIRAYPEANGNIAIMQDLIRKDQERLKKLESDLNLYHQKQVAYVQARQKIAEQLLQTEQDITKERQQQSKTEASDSHKQKSAKETNVDIQAALQKQQKLNKDIENAQKILTSLNDKRNKGFKSEFITKLGQWDTDKKEFKHNTKDIQALINKYQELRKARIAEKGAGSKAVGEEVKLRNQLVGIVRSQKKHIEDFITTNRAELQSVTEVINAYNAKAKAKVSTPSEQSSTSKLAASAEEAEKRVHSLNGKLTYQKRILKDLNDNGFTSKHFIKLGEWDESSQNFKKNSQEIQNLINRYKELKDARHQLNDGKVTEEEETIRKRLVDILAQQKTHQAEIINQIQSERDIAKQAAEAYKKQNVQNPVPGKPSQSSTETLDKQIAEINNRVNELTEKLNKANVAVRTLLSARNKVKAISETGLGDKVSEIYGGAMTTKQLHNTLKLYNELMQKQRALRTSGQGQSQEYKENAGVLQSIREQLKPIYDAQLKYSQERVTQLTTEINQEKEKKQLLIEQKQTLEQQAEAQREIQRSQTAEKPEPVESPSTSEKHDSVDVSETKNDQAASVVKLDGTTLNSLAQEDTLQSIGETITSILQKLDSGIKVSGTKESVEESQKESGQKSAAEKQNVVMKNPDVTMLDSNANTLSTLSGGNASDSRSKKQQVDLGMLYKMLQAIADKKLESYTDYNASKMRIVTDGNGAVTGATLAFAHKDKKSGLVENYKLIQDIESGLSRFEHTNSVLTENIENYEKSLIRATKAQSTLFTRYNKDIAELKASLDPGANKTLFGTEFEFDLDTKISDIKTCVDELNKFDANGNIVLFSEEDLIEQQRIIESMLLDAKTFISESKNAKYAPITFDSKNVESQVGRYQAQLDAFIEQTKRAELYTGEFKQQLDGLKNQLSEVKVGKDLKKYQNDFAIAKSDFSSRRTYDKLYDDLADSASKIIKLKSQMRSESTGSNTRAALEMELNQEQEIHDSILGQLKANEKLYDSNTQNLKVNEAIKQTLLDITKAKNAQLDKDISKQNASISKQVEAEKKKYAELSLEAKKLSNIPLNEEEVQKLDRYKNLLDGLERMQNVMVSNPQLLDNDKYMLQFNNLLLTIQHVRQEFETLRKVSMSENALVSDVALSDTLRQLNTLEEQVKRAGVYSDEFKQKIDFLRNSLTGYKMDDGTEVKGVAIAKELDAYKVQFNSLKSEFETAKSYKAIYDELVESRSKRLQLSHDISSSDKSAKETEKRLEAERKVSMELEKQLQQYNIIFDKQANAKAWAEASQKSSQANAIRDAAQSDKYIDKKNVLFANKVYAEKERYEELKYKEEQLSEVLLSKDEVNKLGEYKKLLDQVELKQKEIASDPKLIDSEDDIRELNELLIKIQHVRQEFETLRNISISDNTKVKSADLDKSSHQLNALTEQIKRAGLYSDDFKNKIESLRNELSQVGMQKQFDAYKLHFDNLKDEFDQMKTYKSLYDDLVTSRTKQIQLEYEVEHSTSSTHEAAEKLTIEREISAELEEQLRQYKAIYNSQADTNAWVEARKKANQEIGKDAAARNDQEINRQNAEINKIVEATQKKYDSMRNSLKNLGEDIPVGDAYVGKMQTYKKLLDQLKIEQDNIAKSPDLLKQDGYRDKFGSLLFDLEKIEKSFNVLNQSALQFLKNIKSASDIKPLSNTFDINNIEQMHDEMYKFANGVGVGKAKLIEFNDVNHTATFEITNHQGQLQRLTVEYNEATNALGRYVSKTNESVSGIQKVISSLKHSFGNVIKYLASFGSVYELFSMIRQGVQYVRNIDTALTELKKVTDETDNAYDNFLQSMSKTAGVVGSTVADLTTMAAEWARLGYSMEESATLAKNTAVLLNVSEFDDATRASEALISTMQAFQYTADESGHVVDILNEVGNNYAVSSDGIATALQDSASALMEGGNNLEQAVALVAAANRVVQDPSSVGSALRTISLRLRGTSVEILEEMGEETDGVVESTSKLQEKLKALTGVNILTETGAYKDTYTILKEIGLVWDNLTDIDKAATLELMAGKNRANTLSAILTNMKDLEGAYESALNAEGSALRENEAYLDSIQGRINLFTNALQTMWMNFLNDDALKFIIDIGTALIKFVDTLGVIPTAIGGFSAFKLVAKSIGEEFASMGKEIRKTMNITDLDDEESSIFSNLKDNIDEATKAKEEHIEVTEESANAERVESGEIDKNTVAEVNNAAATQKGLTIQEVDTNGDIKSAGAEKIEAEAIRQNTNATLANNAANAAGAAAGAAKSGVISNVGSVAGSIGGTLLKAGGTLLKGLAFGAAMAVVTKIVGWGIGWINDKIHETERAIERADEALNTYRDEMKSIETEKETIDELSVSYSRLSNGVNPLTNENIGLTTEAYEEYLDVVNQIADIHPELVAGYDAEGNAILNLKGKVEGLTAAYQEAQEKAALKLLSSDNKDDVWTKYEENIASFTNDKDLMTKQQEKDVLEAILAMGHDGWNSELARLYKYDKAGNDDMWQVLKWQLKEMGTYVDDNMMYWTLNTLHVPNKDDFESLEAYRNYFVQELSEINQEISDGMNGVRETLSASLIFNPLYNKDNFSDESKNIVKSIITNIDPKMIAESGAENLDDFIHWFSSNVISKVAENEELHSELSNVSNDLAKAMLEGDGEAFDEAESKFNELTETWRIDGKIKIDPDADPVTQYLQQLAKDTEEESKNYKVRLKMQTDFESGNDIDDILADYTGNAKEKIQNAFDDLGLDESASVKDIYGKLNIFAGEDNILRTDELRDAYSAFLSDDMGDWSTEQQEAIIALDGVLKLYGTDIETVITLLTELGIVSESLDDISSFNLASESTNEDIDAFQEKISTLKDAWESLNSKEMTKSDFIDLVQEFPALMEGVDLSDDNWMVKAKENVEALNDTTITNFVTELETAKQAMAERGEDTTIVQSFIDYAEQLREQLKQVDAVIKTHADTVSGLTESYENYKNILTSTDEVLYDGQKVSESYYETLKEFIGDADKLNACFDENNKQIITNADGLRKLIEEQKEVIAQNVQLAKAQSQLKYHDLVKRLDMAVEGYYGLDDAGKATTDALIEQISTVKNSINQYQLLEDSLLGTTSAFEKFAQAQEADSKNTYGDQYVEMAQTMYDAIYKTGEVGSEQFWAAVRANVPEDIYAHLTPGKEQINAISDYLNSNVFSTLTLDDTTFSIDYSAIENFVEKAQEVGVFTGTDATSFGLSADFIHSLKEDEDALEAFAERMNMTTTQVYAMLAEMDNYNADGIGLSMLLQLDQSTTGQIALMTNELEKLYVQRKALLEQGADEVTLNANMSEIYAAEAQLAGLEKQATDAVIAYAAVDNALIDTSKKVSEVLPDKVITELGLTGDEKVQDVLQKVNDYLLTLEEPTIVDLNLAKENVEEELENFKKEFSEEELEANVVINEEGLKEIKEGDLTIDRATLERYVTLENTSQFIDDALAKGLTTTETLLSEIAENTAITAGKETLPENTSKSNDTINRGETATSSNVTVESSGDVKITGSQGEPVQQDWLTPGTSAFKLAGDAILGRPNDGTDVMMPAYGPAYIDPSTISGGIEADKVIVEDANIDATQGKNTSIEMPVVEDIPRTYEMPVVEDIPRTTEETTEQVENLNNATQETAKSTEDILAIYDAIIQSCSKLDSDTMISADELNSLGFGHIANEAWSAADAIAYFNKMKADAVVSGTVGALYDVNAVKEGILTYSELQSRATSFNDLLSQTDEIISDNTEVTQAYRDSLLELCETEEERAEVKAQFDERDGKLLVKNSRALKKLVKEKKKELAADVKLSKAHAQLEYYDLYKQIHDLVNSTEVMDGATLNYINSLYEEMGAIQRTIAKYSLLEAQLLGASNAYDKLAEAQEADTATDYGSKAEELMSVLGTAFSTGQLGTQAAQVAIEGLVPESVFEDADTLDEKMQKIYDYFSGGPVSKLFTIEYDENGTPTSVEMTENDVEEFTDNLFTTTLNPEIGEGTVFQGTWDEFTLNPAIETLEDFAKACGLTEEVAFAFLTELEKYDINWLGGDFETLLDKLMSDDLAYGIQEATQKMADQEIKMAELRRKVAKGELSTGDQEYIDAQNEYNAAQAELEVKEEQAITDVTDWSNKTKLLEEQKEHLEELAKEYEELKASDMDADEKEKELERLNGEMDSTTETIDGLIGELELLGVPTEFVIEVASAEAQENIDEFKEKWATAAEDGDEKAVKITAAVEEIDTTGLDSLEELGFVQNSDGTWEAGANVKIKGWSELDSTSQQEIIGYINMLEEQHIIDLLLGGGTKTVEEHLADISRTLEHIAQLFDPTYTIDVDTKNAQSKVATFKTSWDGIKSKSVTVWASIKQNASNLWSKLTGGDWANGTAHAQGTAFKNGSWGAEKSETALVGELGPELLVRGNRWTTIGENGAEFKNIKKGDIIFNHKQTEDLLSKGYVTGRGKAYAEGTAYAGINTWTDKVKGSQSFTGLTGSEISNASSKLSKAAQDISTASDKLSDDFKEVFDWIEVRIEEITEDIDLENAKLENTIGSKNQNAIIDNMIELNQKLYDNLTSGASKYYEYAQKLLAKVPVEYRKAAQDGSIAIESFTGKVGESILEAIQDYREWVQKGDDSTQQAEETSAEISSLAKQAIDNIAADYENKTSLQDIKIEQYEAYNSLLETDVGSESAAVYQAMIKANNENVKTLEEQRNKMQTELNKRVQSGEIKKYSQDWYDAINDIAAVDTEIINLKTDTENWQDDINNLHWDQFDGLKSRLESVSDEADNLIDILSDKDAFDEAGEWTKEGITQLGLYAQKMEVAEVTAAEYKKEINYLNKNWQKLGYTEEEYIEKLDELKDGQYDAIQSYNDSKKAIVDLTKERVEAIKEGIDKEIKSYEKLIDTKKKELDAEQDLYNFQKNVKNQQKDIADIERQLAALSGDNSAAARAKRAQLQAELAEANASLEDQYYNRSIENQQEALDKELENFQKTKEEEKEGWDKYLEDTNQVVSDGLATVQANTETVYTTLKQMGSEYSLSISESITSPWKDGETAIQNFSTKFGTSMSTTVTELEALATKFKATMTEIETAGKNAVDNVAKNAQAYTKAKELEGNTGGTGGGNSGNGGNSGSDGNSGGETYPYGKASSTSGNIKQGARGNNVKAIQYALNQLGYGNSGTQSVDGIFGSGTTKAVKAFQKAMGISADGIVGTQTRQKFKAKGYATGTTGVKEDQFAWIDEMGLEEIVLHAQNGKLAYLTKGSAVLPNDISENLMELGQLDPSVILERNKPQIGLPSEIHNTEIHIDNSVAELIHIDNCSTETLPDVKKIVNEALEKHTKSLNNALKKYVR